MTRATMMTMIKHEELDLLVQTMVEDGLLHQTGAIVFDDGMNREAWYDWADQDGFYVRLFPNHAELYSPTKRSVPATKSARQQVAEEDAAATEAPKA